MKILKLFEDIEEVLVYCCHVLKKMTSEVKKLTNYHWLVYE
ncbi:hypothetical protein [Okeania sp.]|nr:hypothetical protein [Okeania sp.]